MQSLDNLRRVLPWCCEHADTDECRKYTSCREHIADMLDAIERELAERYVALPVDADGEVIHIGDVMVSPFGNVYEVEGILPDRYLVLKGDDWLTIETAGSRHYHAPTVEDLLRQVIACATNGYYVHGAIETEDIIAEYAAKLRLAKEDE